MKRIARYVKLLWVLPLMAGATLYAQSPQSSPILIVEAQLGTSTSASQEFIELANVTQDSVDVSNWRVEYYSAASDMSQPSRTMPLHGELPAGAHYLLASTDYLSDIANDTFTATLAKTGGHLRLVETTDTAKTVHDLLGWGTAAHPAGQAATSPADDNSLQRKQDDSGSYSDTANNAADFIQGTPSPAGFVPATTDNNSSPDTSSNPSVSDPANQTDDTQGTQNIATQPESYSEPYITELLPNPAPPASDSQEEYVELYNPNDAVLSLTGYKLQSGSNYTYSFTFADEEIPARSYKAFYVTETKLTLANTAGRARLINPNGQIVSETDAYGTADDGQAWMWDGTVWQWTITSTPSAANKLTLVAAKEPTVAAGKKTSTAKKAGSASKTKTSSAKKTTKTGVAGASSDGSTSAENVDATPALHPAVLAGVGGIALLYAGYEYRHDMANALYRLRRHRKLGAKNRASA